MVISMNRQEQVIYYKDELQDEFAGDHIVAKKIDGGYRYLNDSLAGRILHIFWYRVVATPLAAVYMKLHFHHKIVNKKVLQEAEEMGYFMFGNHTHFLADPLVPTRVNFPKRVSVIVHPNNVSMPVLGKITPFLGALPLPDDQYAAKNFLNAIKTRIGAGDCIMIYPEAHIWPYYTDIRPFTDASFRYPVQYHAPVFSLTNTYQKRRFSKKPRMVTYIDGPFYSDRKLTAKEQKRQLRDVVYQTMKKRALANQVCLIQYKRVNEIEK